MTKSTILFKRGKKADLPNRAIPGEPLIALDTCELFIGNVDGVVQKLSDIFIADTEPDIKDKFWWDTTTEQLKRFDGSMWKPLEMLNNGMSIGPNEPDSTQKIWIDTADEDVDQVFQSELAKDIKNTVTDLSNKVDKISYAIDYELDPGYFKGILPGADPSNSPTTDPNVPQLDDGAKGTVGHILLKRGLKSDLDTLQEGEFGFCLDTEELYVGNKGRMRLIARVGGIDSGNNGNGNVTADYLELVSSNGNKYRLTVNDAGEPIIFSSDADTANSPDVTDSGRFKGLFINKVYGGGARNTNSTPVSHSFIELYNTSEAPINLKGLSLQYGEYMGEWKVLPLRGIVKPYTSFLIRCAQHSDPYRLSTRFKILDFDMSWDIPISDNGYKVYLCVGTDPCKFTNPANTDGSWTKALGYINLFASGGEDVTRAIDGYEKTYLHLVNKYGMLKRAYSVDVLCAFANTGDNGADIEYIDMRSASLDVYAPRSSSYGQWNFYYNQLPLDIFAPNVINICFGQDGDTTRTFTWQSQVTDKGYIKYRKKDESNWKIIPSSKSFVAHPDVDVTVHSVILRGLEPGNIYVYKAGFEGHWSDEYELEIKKVDDTSTIKMLWTTDQQGWDAIEYSAWGKANAYIESHETYDFILNTGDISQNGNRSFEWREYFDQAKQNMNTHVQMTCVGNNDLVDKLYSIAYTYYTTIENAPYPSVYSFNYGYCHFICLDSNILTDPLDATKTIRGSAEQIAFIKADMAKPENKKRWVIAYMHEAPYTIINNSKKLRPFINALYDAGVDLVLNGHHHCYTRSNRMGKTSDVGTTYVDNIDNANGIYYIMSQATGFKLSGKTTPATVAPWRAFFDKPGDPCYGTFTITWDKIEFVEYRLTNIMPLEDNVGKEVIPIVLDSLTILPKANRG